MRKALIIAILLTVIPVVDAAKAEEEAILSTARKSGVVKCLPKLGEVATYLELPSSIYSVSDSAFSKDADNRMYNSVIIKQFSDGTTSLASATVSPYGTECDLSLLQVFTANTNCTELRERTLKEWKYVKTIKDVIKLVSEKGSSFYLKPVGSGCVAVKTE